MLFSYIALNPKNQRLKGVINAKDESGAKKKLHNVGLSVISLRVSDESEIESVEGNEKKQLNKQSFVFFVIDPQGKRLSGTIDAEDKKHALKRLAKEYGFEILSLCDTSIPSDMQFKEGQKGLKELEEEVEYEFGVTFKHSEEGIKEREQDTEIYDSEFEVERTEILKEIEIVSSKTQDILSNFSEEISLEDFSKIEGLLGDLVRLRFSNNFSLIRKLIEELFENVEIAMAHIREKKEEKGDYDEIQEEEELLEFMSSHSGNTNKDILKKLQGYSSSLDKFLSPKKGKPKKKKAKKAGVFDEPIEDFVFFRRFLKSSAQTIMTGNKELRKERFRELKKKWKFWKEKKEKLAHERKLEHEKKIIQKKQRKGLRADLEFFFFFLDEFRHFFGAFIAISILFGYASFFIVAQNIDFKRTLLESKIYSDIFPLFIIAGFLIFFTLVIQKKFLARAFHKTLIFLGISFLCIVIYFINL